MDMDLSRTQAIVAKIWDESILPTHHQYIRIPNQSPIFDPEWRAHGFMDEAVKLATDWVRSRNIPGCQVEVLRLPGRTPVVLIEVEGKKEGEILLYGHLDKQPPFEGWREQEGLGPWTPVEIDGKLYGRGAADDGYAIFAITAAIEAIQAQGAAHPRLVGLVECCEESGSTDLPDYMDKFAERIGVPRLVICLDSGCGDYERLWNTTSLRGLVAGNLKVEVLTEGVHSGDASGIVPSSFRILRLILDRLEDSATGEIRPKELHAAIPELRRKQVATTAAVLGREIYERLPFSEGVGPISTDLTELLLNRTWRPSLAVTAVAGMPTLEQGGNVLRPFTAVKLSLRVPPTLDARKATDFVKDLLEKDPPYGARVTFESEKCGFGWEAAAPEPWLSASLEKASISFFGKPPCDLGEGGSIPFMAMLGERFPKAQFLITGVLGPHSNAHGPNEFLHIAVAKAVTASVALVISDAARAGS